MGIIGKTITVINEKTGKSTDFYFTDSPMARFLSGLYEACEVYGLDQEESLALGIFYLAFDKKRGGVLLKPKRGFEKLIKRGWAENFNGTVRFLTDHLDLDAIEKCAYASMKFGESIGKA
jgi:hypothetical protein